MKSTFKKDEKILIDNSLLYDPAAHLISSSEEKVEIFSLALPASMCLQYLLEKHGELVTHQELLNHVWNARGMNVSISTLYQNVSLIRKTFLRAGVEKEIIKTLPKRGFMIPSEIIINLYQAEIKESSDKVYKGNEGEKREHKWYKLKKALDLKSIVFLMVTFGALFIASMFFYAADKIADHSFGHYKDFMEVDGCHVYRNSNTRNDEYYRKMLMNYNIPCIDKKWWYMTNYPPSEKVSLIQCLRPLDGLTDATARCTSNYYLK